MGEIELKPDPNDPNLYKADREIERVERAAQRAEARPYRPPPKRPTKVQEEAVQRAIMQRWPPDRILDVIDQAHQFAYKTKSWKGLMEVARFLAEYTVGKPKQALNLTKTATPEDWAEFFRDKQLPEAEAYGTFEDGDNDGDDDGDLGDIEGLD